MPWQALHRGGVAALDVNADTREVRADQLDGTSSSCFSHICWCDIISQQAHWQPHGACVATSQQRMARSAHGKPKNTKFKAKSCTPHRWCPPATTARCSWRRWARLRRRCPARRRVPAPPTGRSAGARPPPSWPPAPQVRLCCTFPSSLGGSSASYRDVQHRYRFPSQSLSRHQQRILPGGLRRSPLWPPAPQVRHCCELPPQSLVGSSASCGFPPHSLHRQGAQVPGTPPASCPEMGLIRCVQHVRGRIS